MKSSLHIRRMTFAAACLALCMVLPFLTGQIPQFGRQLSPMHLPVMLCGFLCGWPWALAVGLIAPPLRYLLFGMPPLFPNGVGMMAELAVYGAVTGLLYAKLPKRPVYIYLSLILAMLVGRLVWGLVSIPIYALLTEKTFTLMAFWTGGFVTAWPGIVLQIVLIPAIVLALEKAKLIQQ